MIIKELYDLNDSDRLLLEEDNMNEAIIIPAENQVIPINDVILYLRQLIKDTKGASGNNILISKETMMDYFSIFSDTINDDGTIYTNQLRIDSINALNKNSI